MPTIDPLRMSQFFALPGAAELVEAFSAIPPGPVRDSVVSHAQVLAAAAGWSPPVPFGMQPALARPAPPPKRLPSPFAEGLSAASLEGQIIERLMRGEADHQVADDLGVKLGVLVRLKAKARREGGLAFPGDDGIETTARGWKPVPPKGQRKAPAGSRKGKKLNLSRMPVPAPPYWWEDPQSPVWDNGRLLPGISEDATGSMAAVGPLDYRNFVTMTTAAERHGLTLKQYMARRFEIIRRVEAGEKPAEIALDLRMAPYGIYSLLQKIGRGRMETLNARPLEPRQADPLPEDLPAAEPAPAPAPAPTGRGRGTASGHVAKVAAAEAWGFPNIEAYEAMREKVRDLRMAGDERPEISEKLGMHTNFIKATLQYWRRERGVEFPNLILKPRRKKAA